MFSYLEKEPARAVSSPLHCTSCLLCAEQGGLVTFRGDKGQVVSCASDFLALLSQNGSWGASALPLPPSLL